MASPCDGDGTLSSRRSPSGEPVEHQAVEFQVVRSRSGRRKQRRRQPQHTVVAATKDSEGPEESPASFLNFMKHHFPDLPFDAPCHILMFEDVWDWEGGLRYFKTAHSWTEVAQERDRIATTIEKQPWFHAFHVETRRILNVRRLQVTLIENPPESYLERLLENIDIPLEIKPKLL